MHFIGDVHGMFLEYIALIKKLQLSHTFQVGDMGLGFPDNMNKQLGYPVLDTPSHQHRFIRGNHDNPTTCFHHPNYMGDYGYIEELDLFFLSGGLSIDKDYRIAGTTWWEGEELSWAALGAAMELYKKVRPGLVVTHECPSAVKAAVLARGTPFNPKIHSSSRTENVLEAMYRFHKPDQWIFGHYHVDFKSNPFVCVPELGVYEVPGLEWPEVVHVRHD